MHDAGKVLMGGVVSSAKEISTHDSDPATFKAGLVVRQKSDGALSLAKSDGFNVGVSIGKSLSDTKKTGVVRTGTGVPILLETGFTDPVIGEKVYVDDTSGKAEADDAGDVTITDAIYVSEMLTGIDEAGNEVNVALIDMPGGL